MNSRFSRLAQVYFSYFAILGVVSHYFGLYLDAIGLSSFMVGVVLAVMTLGRIVGPFIWASIADKKQNKRQIIQLGSVLATVCYCGLFFDLTVIPLVCLLFLFTVFWAAILPQLESLTASNFKGNSHLYSKARLWGSVSFTCLVLIAGVLFEYLGVKLTVELFTISLLLILSLSSFRLPVERSIKRCAITAAPIFPTLKRMPVIIFFASCFLLQVSFATYYGFFSIYLTKIGYSGLEVGALIALGVVAEILLFMKAGRWLGRFNLNNVFIFCYVLTGFRWLVIGSVPESIMMLAAVQVIHAFSYGLHHLAVQKFIRREFSVNQQSRGQAMYIGLSYGCGGALGALLTGAIWDFNMELTFILAAGLSLCAALLMFISKAVRPI